jgi:hypothetical protein
MNPINFYNSVVHTVANQRGLPIERAEVAVKNEYPDVWKLYRAFAATEDQAVRFFNERANARSASEMGAAREQFQTMVRERMDKFGFDYNTAFNSVARDYPDLLGGPINTGKSSQSNKSSGLTPTSYGGPIGASGKVGAVKSPWVLTMFRLPVSTDQATFDAAWSANDARPGPVNFGKVFAALVTKEESDSGLTPERALAAAKSKFPDLWAMVEKVSNSLKY